MLKQFKNINIYIKEIKILIPQLFPVMLPSLPYKINPKISEDCIIDEYIHPLA